MALGDIVQVLDTQGFAVHALTDIVGCARNANIAVLLTRDLASGHPLARSIAISNAGLITATPEDSLVLHDHNMTDPGLIHFYDDVFVSITHDDSGYTRLISFLVSDVGAIPAARADLLQIANSSNTNHISELLRVHDHVLLTGSCRASDPKNIETVITSYLGIFTDPPADSMQLSISPFETRFRQGSGTRIVGLFNRSYELNIFTFTCTASGIIPATPTDTWLSYTSATSFSSLAKVTDLVYAVLGLDVGGNAVIRTFSINADGTINKSFIDTETVEAASADQAFMTEIGGGYFIVAYGVSGVPGRLRTYFIADDGTITDGHISSLDITSNSFSLVSMFHLQGDIWGMAFVGSATEVLLYTLEIETPSDEVPHHEMMLGMGP